MKIFVSDSYGGDICSIKFEKDAQKCFGYAVKVLGFVETNKAKIQHLSSHGRFVTDEVRFKVPRNIIPTFESKNFKVWYMCECNAISKDAKMPFSFVFDIFNNNFEDFQYTSPIDLDMNLVEEDEYLERKEEVCRLILSKMEAPLDPKSLLMPLSKDEKQKGTLSFIQHSPVLNASSPELSSEQISTSPMPAVPTAAGLDNPDSLDLLPPPENLGSIKLHFLQNGTGNVNASPEKIVVEDPEVVSLSDGSQDSKTSGNEDDVFSREVNEEIKSLITQFTAEDASRGQQEHVDTVQEGQKALEEKLCLDPELCSNLQAVKPPSFRDPNLLEIRSYESTGTAMDGSDTIAHITYPTFMRSRGYIRVKYLRNIRSTQVSIWRQDYEDGSMMDVESVFSVTFDSDDCLEKITEFDVRGFSLKNFVFEVRYVLNISFDGSEISLPINVLSPGAKTYTSPVEV